MPAGYSVGPILIAGRQRIRKQGGRVRNYVAIHCDAPAEPMQGIGRSHFGSG